MTATAPPDDTGRQSLRRKSAIKLAVTALVLAFVAWRAWTLVEGQDFSQLRIAPGWLCLSAILYACAWGPSIWFWRTILETLGSKPPWLLAAYAYFAGHMGKYIPGKAGVLLIRAGLLRERGYPLAAGLIASTYETLLMMGIGLALSIALAPYLLPVEILRNWTDYAEQIAAARWIPGAIVFGGVLLTLPLVSMILSALTRRIAPLTGETPQISPSRILRGDLAMIGGWFLMGLSFGTTLHSIAPQTWSLSNWVLWTAAISASMVIGFFAIIVPGGLGVREAVMIEILRVQPDLLESQVVVAAVVLRLVWLATEAVTYAGFAIAERRRGKAPGT